MKTPKITRRTNGTYMAEYKDGSKRKRKSLGTKNKTEAQLRFTQICGLTVPSKPALHTTDP